MQALIDACIQDDDKLYLCVSSPTIKDKPVQIRPWRLSDADFVLDASLPLDPRKTVFVGGVPRPLKAGKAGNEYTRFGYLNFRQKFLIPYGIGAILPKIFCRFQIWARKHHLSLGYFPFLRDILDYKSNFNE